MLLIVITAAFLKPFFFLIYNIPLTVVAILSVEQVDKISKNFWNNSHYRSTPFKVVEGRIEILNSILHNIRQKENSYDMIADNLPRTVSRDEFGGQTKVVRLTFTRASSVHRGDKFVS